MQRELYVNKGGNTGRALVLLDRALFSYVRMTELNILRMYSWIELTIRERAF